MKGYGNSYDFGARMYDSRFGRWLSLDAMRDKYPDISPFVGFANNPVLYVDPAGEAVKPYGSMAYNVILWSVSPEESKYIKLDDNGFVDKTNLKKGLEELGDVSGNYSSLMELVDNEKILEVYVSRTFETSNGEFDMGITDYSSEMEAMYSAHKKIGGKLSKEEFANKYPQWETQKGWGGHLGQSISKE